MQSFNTQEGSISSHNRKLHEAFKKDSLQGVNALESDGINISCSGKLIMNTTHKALDWICNVHAAMHVNRNKWKDNSLPFSLAKLIDLNVTYHHFADFYV